MEKEQSFESERLMHRQIEAMVGKAQQSEFGVQEMLKLDNLRADHFGEYVFTERKREGSLYKKTCSSNLQSSLTHLYKIYQKKKSKEFKEDLTEIMLRG